jgi:hypothetical protein
MHLHALGTPGWAEAVVAAARRHAAGRAARPEQDDAARGAVPAGGIA